MARFNENDELDEVQNIEVDHAMSQWSECAGVVSAVVQPPAANVLFFFYFCGGTVYVQSLAMPSIAQANFMLLEAGNASHLAIQIVDNQTLQILKRFMKVSFIFHEFFFFAVSYLARKLRAYLPIGFSKLV